MTTRAQVQPFVQITDPGIQAGFEEAQAPYFADCRISTDMRLIEIVRAMHTEVAVERGLSEQRLRRSTGFILGILSERSEAIIIGRLLYSGYTVLKPYGENQRYDLVIEDADRQFWRVQCKTGWLSKDQKTIMFNLCSNHYAYAWQKNTMIRKHYRGDVEYFAVYSPDTDKVYLIPIDHVGTNQASLRLVPTTNKQEKNVRWAQDYEL